MADMDNLESIQESFNYISDALDTMRAQSALNTGNLDRLMTEISNNLEVIANDDTAELIKVFLIELKKGIDDRHNFVSDKFIEMQKNFNNIIEKADKQLTGSEIKELFEIIATNLGSVSRSSDSQKHLIDDLGYKIEAFQKDTTQKDEILRNISTVKIEIEKVNNGYESTILNLNNNFKKVNELLAKFDSKDAFAALNKDIENIFMSSNAILSTMQVIDHKNRELEETINTFITKEDFNIEREQVANLISQNIQLSDYIKKLPTQNNFEDLTGKIDTSIGIINALKNMLTETGKQNQQMLIAQLDSLEAKILNISTEEEFIGFRKELSEFAKEVMESTNLIRADLADTNQGLKSLYEFLNTMDIKNSFLNFTEITKSTETSIKNALSSHSATIGSQMNKNQDDSKNIVLESITRTKENIEKAKTDINEFTQANKNEISQKIILTNENIDSVKTAIKNTNEDNLISIDEKLSKVKEDVVNTGHFVIQNSQKSIENLLSDMDKIFNELLTLKQNITDSTIQRSQDNSNNLQVMQERLQETKEELTNTTTESLGNMLSVVEEFSREIVKTKETIETGYGTNSLEIKEIMSGLSLKLNSLQEVLTRGYEVNFAEVKHSVDELNNLTQATKSTLEKNTTFGFSGLSANLEELSNKLTIAEETLDIKAQSNLEKIEYLFVELKNEVELSKNFLKDSDRSNYDIISTSISDLSKRLEDVKDNINGNLRTEISSVHSSILSLPEVIKQNHIEIEENNTKLIEAGTQNLKDIFEKIEGLAVSFVTKDNPFKEDVFFNFSELKSKMEILKEDFSKTSFELDESVSNQVNDTLRSIEALVSQYTDKYSNAFQELRGNIQDYFVSVNKIYAESDEKLNSSLSETYEIKAEIEGLKEIIADEKNDPKFYEAAAEIHRRFDALSNEISEFEQSFVSGNNELSNNILNSLENKFNSISSIIHESKDLIKEDSKEILVDINEKTEELKGQLNLTATDVINALSARSSEIASILLSVGENVENISQDRFEDEFVQLKNKIDNILLSTVETINVEVEKGNHIQLEKISSEFSSIGEILNVILSKVSSDNTREIMELRSILTERVDNISSINNILGTLLEQMNSISHHFNQVKSLIESSKEEIVQKIDLVENSLLKTHEDTREIIVEKTTESQTRATAVVIDKIRESSDELKTINSQMIYQYKHETKEAIDDLKEELLSKPVDFNPVIDKLQNSTEEIVFGVKEEILNKAQSNESAISEAILETKENLGEKITSLKDSFTYAQDEIKNSVSEEISSSKEELRESLFSKIENAKDETKRAIVNKIVESQEDSKTGIIQGIAEYNDKNNTALVYGIKENLSEISQSLSAQYKEVASENRAEMIYKLTGIADELVLLENNARTYYEKISENQIEKGDILNNIASKQENNSGTIEEIRNQNNENKEIIFEESKQIQEKLRLLLSENLTEEQAQYREFVLNELSKLHDGSKEEILKVLSDNNEETVNVILSEIRQIRDVMSQGVIENLSEISENLSAQYKEVASENRAETIHKLTNIVEELSLLQNNSRAYYEKINENQIEKSDILNNIASKQENNAETIEEIRNQNNENKEIIFEESKRIQEKLRLLLSENLTEEQAQYKEFVLNELSKLHDNSREEILRVLSDNNEETVNLILFEIGQIQDKISQGVIENLSEISENLSVQYKEIVSENRAETIHKLTNIAEELELLQNTFGTNYEIINQNQIETKDILNNIASKQENNSGTIEEIRNQNNENKEIIFEESKRIQEKLHLLLSENLTEEQAQSREFVLNELSKLHDGSKEEILRVLSGKNEETVNVILSEIRQVQDRISQGVIENLSANKDSERQAMLEDLRKVQSNSRELVLDKLIEINDETKRAVLDEVENGLSQIKSEIEKILVEEENVEDNENANYQKIEELKNFVEEFTANLEEKICQTQETNKNEINGIVSNIKEGFYEKVEDGFDNMKNMLDVLSDKVEIENNLEDLRISILNKLSETASDIDCSISSISLKEEIKEFVSDVELTIGNVFFQVKEDILEILDNNNDGTEDLEQLNLIEANIEELKSGILSDILEKVNEFEINLATQTRGITDINEEITKSVEDLKVIIKDVNTDSKDAIVELLDKFSENATEKLDENLKSTENIKVILKEIITESEENISSVLDKFINEISSKFEENSQESKNTFNEKINKLTEKLEAITEKLNEPVQTDENLKSEIEAVSQKLDLIMLEADSENDEKIEEISIEVLGIKEKINLLIEKADNEIEIDTTDIQSGISKISKKIEEIFTALKDKTQIDNNKRLEEELAEISQKIDVMMLQDATLDEEIFDNEDVVKILSEKIDAIHIPQVNNSQVDISAQVEEIKNIVSSQKSFVEALKNLASSKTNDIDLSKLENSINEKMKFFEQKLSNLIVPIKNTENELSNNFENVESQLSNQNNGIDLELESFKTEIIESILSIFGEISFVEEAEDIKDFVNEKIEELQSQISSISRVASVSYVTDGANVQNINVDAVLSKVDDSYLDIRKEINDLKQHLLSVQNSDEDEDYTLQDVESDIAKVRVILKELSERKQENSNNFSDKEYTSFDLSKISEDLTSISSRTNKLLLNSDESYSALRENLNDLRDVVNVFEKRVKTIDTKEPIEKIDKKLDTINQLVLSNVQSDKIFNQTFMYLAEWIDRADEKLNKLEQDMSDVTFIKQNILKKSDLESMFEKFAKKFDKQQEKIKSLEEKIKELSKKESIVKPTATNIRTIVNEVLSKVETAPKSDTTLVKKVDGIDRQLVNLGKSIEKITSYVDE